MKRSLYSRQACLLLIIAVLGIVSCTKDPATTDAPVDPALESMLPKKIVTDNHEHYFFYNSDSQVFKIKRNPWLQNGATYTIADVDSTFIYYNADKTISRVLKKHEGGGDVTRNAIFFEYSAGKLLKVYTKSTHVLYTFQPYDAVYELQRGPIDYSHMYKIDSLAYDSRGRLGEVYRFLIENSYGANPEGYFRVPGLYTKFSYMPGSDSVFSQIVQKENPTISTTLSNLVIGSYDSSARNPVYKSLKYAVFATYLDLMPLGYAKNSSIGTTLSLCPYLLKTIGSASGGLVVTNKSDPIGKTLTSATYGIFGGGGFTFYY